MNTKNKLAVFDIDGTLTNSVQVHQTAFVHALEAVGLKDFDTNWSGYKHHTDSFIFNTIFHSQFGKEATGKDIAQFESALDTYVSIGAAANPINEINGANFFLELLVKNSGFDIVFATGSLLKPAKQKLTQSKISIHDNLISTANTLFTREELVLEAIEKAKKHYDRDGYEQIISFGDGLWDYNTSLNLDIDFIGIGNRKLLEHGVAHFFPDFEAPLLFSLLNMEYGRGN